MLHIVANGHAVYIYPEYRIEPNKPLDRAEIVVVRTTDKRVAESLNLTYNPKEVISS